MKPSDTAGAFLGILNLNAFFLQALVIGIIFWIEADSFWLGVIVVIGLFILLGIKKLAWLVIAGFTLCWFFAGISFWGFGGGLVMGLMGFGLNWSVSQFAQVMTGEHDQREGS